MSNALNPTAAFLTIFLAGSGVAFLVAAKKQDVQEKSIVSAAPTPITLTLTVPKKSDTKPNSSEGALRQRVNLKNYDLIKEGMDISWVKILLPSDFKYTERVQGNQKRGYYDWINRDSSFYISVETLNDKVVSKSHGAS